MKRGCRIGCIFVCIVLLAALAYVANAFFGNPVSLYLAERAARAYLAENYAHLDVTIEKTGYSFKTSDYYAFVSSPTSVDTHFSIYMTPLGAVRYDTYDNVSGGFNTWNRLESEYRAKVEAVLDSPDFALRHDIAFGTLTLWEESVYDYRPVPYGIRPEELTLDGQYDISELGKAAGSIVFYMQDEDVSFETAAKGMLYLKKILEENGVSFFAMDFVLRLPREEGQPGNLGPSIHVANFLCKEIAEDGMAQRVQDAHNALDAFYAQLDQEK